MGMVSINCGTCGMGFAVDDSLRGSKVLCPGCKAKIDVVHAEGECPRCGKPVGPNDKVCSACAFVLPRAKANQQGGSNPEMYEKNYRPARTVLLLLIVTSALSFAALVFLVFVAGAAMAPLPLHLQLLIMKQGIAAVGITGLMLGAYLYALVISHKDPFNAFFIGLATYVIAIGMDVALNLAAWSQAFAQITHFNIVSVVLWSVILVRGWLILLLYNAVQTAQLQIRNPAGNTS